MARSAGIIPFLSGDGEIVSVFGRGGIPDLFVVAFATRKGRIGPIALNPLVAKILAASLQEHLQKIGALPPTPQQGAWGLRVGAQAPIQATHQTQGSLLPCTKISREPNMADDANEHLKHFMLDDHAQAIGYACIY